MHGVLFHKCVFFYFVHLEQVLEGSGVDSFDGDSLDGDGEGSTRGVGVGECDSLGLGLSDELGALLAGLAEGSGAVVVLNVLNADVDSLGLNAGVDTLVNDDTNGAGSDVPDTTSLTMVVLVGHTLLDATSTNNIDQIADLVGGQVLGEADMTLLTVGDGESLASTRAVTVRVRHLCFVHQIPPITNQFVPTIPFIDHNSKRPQGTHKRVSQGV